MTDLPHSPDDEVVSAVLDGEASPAERARVAGDPALSRRLDELSRIRDAVAEPVVPMDELTARRIREEALATAPPPAWRSAGPEVHTTSRPWWQGGSLVGIGSVAAVVLIALLVVPALVAGGDDDDTATADVDAATMDATEQRTDTGDGGSSPGGDDAFAEADDADLDEADGAAPDLGGPRPWLGRFDSIEELAASFDPGAGPTVSAEDPAPSVLADPPDAPAPVPECAELDTLDAVELVGAFDAWVDGRPWAVLQVVSPEGDEQILGVDLDTCDTVLVE